MAQDDSQKGLGAKGSPKLADRLALSEPDTGVSLLHYILLSVRRSLRCFRAWQAVRCTRKAAYRAGQVEPFASDLARCACGAGG
jgi:hypothetical protein